MTFLTYYFISTLFFVAINVTMAAIASYKLSKERRSHPKTLWFLVSLLFAPTTSLVHLIPLVRVPATAINVYQTMKRTPKDVSEEADRLANNIINL